MAGPWDKYRGGVQIKPADPTLPYKAVEARNQAAASEYAAPKAAADTTIAQANAGNAGVVADAEARKARADADKAQAELDKLRAEQSQVDPKSGAYRALQEQIDRTTELWQTNLYGGAPNWISGNLPDLLRPENGQFESAAQGLVNPFMAAFRVPGVGSQSDAELRQFLTANTPASGDSDLRISEKIKNIQTRLDAQLGTEKMDRSTALPSAGADAGLQNQLSTGMRDEVDPVLKGISAKVGTMLAQGKSRSEIAQFMRSNGVDPASTSLDKTIQDRATPKAKAWMRQNPGAPYPVGPSFYTKQVPMTPARKIGNAAAQTGLGAYLMNAGQGVTGNRLDDMANALGGNGEAINTGMELSRAQHPAASFAGDVSGQAMSQYLMGRIPGLRALPNSTVGRLAEDGIYGAYAGSGQEGVGAVSGALTNMGGGALARGGAKLVKGAATGLTNPNLSYLNQADVPLTIGRMGRGSGGKVGDIVGGLEDRFAGLPIADAIINTARRHGDEGFNAAAFREMGGSGLTGAKGVAEGEGLVNNAYNFLDGTNLPLDAQFAGTNAGIRANLPRNFGGDIAGHMDDIDASAPNGILSGRDWQSGVRATRANRSSLAGQPFADKAVNTLGDVETNLMGLAGRQGPAGTIDNLAAANKLNGQFQTLTSALDNGLSQARGELFSPSRLDAASRQGARNFGGRTASMQGERPFYSLSQAGMEVMPNLTPDSGTAGRSLLYASLPAILGGGAGAAYAGLTEGRSAAAEGGAEGAGIGAAGTIIPTLALMALYSKGGQKGFQKLMLGQRPAAMKTLGDMLNADNPLSMGARSLLSSRTAGNIGGGMARDLALYPELYLDPNQKTVR